MSLPAGCGALINNITKAFIPDPDQSYTLEQLTQEITTAITQQGYVGGECGVVFEAIEKNSTQYQIDNNLSWDELNSIVYDACIGPKQPPKSQQIGLQFLAYFSTIIIMVGMGCDIDIKACWEHLKRPWGVLVGVFCQFLIMPCIALMMAKIFSGSISDYQALIILLMGCSPGGSLSNLMSVWIQADVNLSVTMTLSSTVLSLGMIPLLLLIMKPAITDANIDVPFDSIAITLVVLLAPLALGVALGYYKKNWAEKIQKVTALLGLVAIIANIIMAFIMYPQAINTAGWEMWFIGALFPLIGASFGYTIAFLVGKFSPCLGEKEFRHKQYRTVSLETGAQNLRLANTIVQTSFISCPKAIEQMLFFPLIYAIFQTLECLIVAGLWKVYMRRKSGSMDTDRSVVDEDEVVVTDMESKKRNDDRGNRYIYENEGMDDSDM